METRLGGCHCGKVRFRITAELGTATLCNCSMCIKKGFVHVIVPPEQFELLEGGAELVSYRFNTGVADHKFCKHCGIHSFYTPRSDPDKIDVNARCLDGFDDAELDALELKRFDGKHWEDAIKNAHWQRNEQHVKAAIVELAVLDIKPGQTESFETAFAQAQAIIARSPGYQRHELRHCSEHAQRYVLLVWWDSIESHVAGFRGSAAYQEWRALLHHFYDPFPTVEHYVALPGLSG